MENKINQFIVKYFIIISNKICNCPIIALDSEWLYLLIMNSKKAKENMRSHSCLKDTEISKTDNIYIYIYRFQKKKEKQNQKPVLGYIMLDRFLSV